MRRWIIAVGALALLAGCDRDRAVKAPVTTPIAPSFSPPAVPAASPAPAPVADVLGCGAPISPTDSYAALKARFGDALRKGDIVGAEGQTANGGILYGATPARTLEVTFWDAALAHPSGVAPADKATGWTGPEGLHLGSTLAAVEAANGRPFAIGGFGWDYGGYAIDYKGGALGKIEGGCTLSVRFDADDSDKPMPDGISGDGVTVMSNDPRVRGWGPVVTQLEIGWPLPPGVKAAD